MAKRKLTSTNSINKETLANFCGMIYAVEMIGGRWKLIILYKLEKRTMRFSELKKIVPGITDRMLTLHLRELEKDGLIKRTAYAEVPPRVEYSLSESGMALIPIWQELEHWGLAHKKRSLNLV
jgi:DNA-binding HxlR family transcriptional regulator